MLIELAMLTMATTSTGAAAGAVVAPPNAVAPIDRPSAARTFALGDDVASPGSLLLAKSSGSGSRGTQSSKSSSNRGAGGYQQTGQGGYRSTGEGGYQGGGQGNKPMNITPPNNPPAVRTTPPSTPIWTPPASAPGN